MNSARVFLGLLFVCCAVPRTYAQSDSDATDCKIVLIAGETAKIDKMGHHDYLAGCACLEALLTQTSGVRVARVAEGWPEDESVFDNAKSVIFYTDGGGKQAFLSSPLRIAKVQDLVNRGVGIVMIHQAVDFPEEFAKQATDWIGGIYLAGASGRGHWPSHHVDFPKHSITRGVEPWEINDGWLNALVFNSQMRGITPLVWSGKEYAGSRAGLDKDIVGWAFERPEGGRSFSFTGLDAHEAWSRSGMRQLMVNGVLWTAGIDIPATGAPCEIGESQLEQMQTPREAKKVDASK